MSGFAKIPENFIKQNTLFDFLCHKLYHLSGGTCKSIGNKEDFLELWDGKSLKNN
jgi:hypothetical protein